MMYRGIASLASYSQHKMRLGMGLLLWCVASMWAVAQPFRYVRVQDQQDMAQWGVRGANYSGIVRLAHPDSLGNLYALVSDKETLNGFYPITLALDSITGMVDSISPAPMVGVVDNPHATYSKRDQEGIAYVPRWQTLFISGEGDQRILEHRLDGSLTGRQLAVPASMGTQAIYFNYGFEALTYSPYTHQFWTTTEHTLRRDGRLSDEGHVQPCLLRLQSFGDDLKPAAQYAYRTRVPAVRKSGRTYAYGVVAMAPLPDGSLLVLEREFYVAQRYMGSWVENRIYRVDPRKGTAITEETDLSSLPSETFLSKELFAEFRTQLKLGNFRLANYEGMCLGPRLPDGRYTLLLVADSQQNWGNRVFQLKDYIRVITFEMDEVDGSSGLTAP